MAEELPKNPFKDERPGGPVDPSLNILRTDLSKSKDVRELEQQIQKLNQLKDVLRTTSKEFQLAESTIKKYNAALVKLRTEKSQLTNATQKLISTIGSGGAGGVFTKFTDTVTEMSTSVDKTTGFMKVFGAQTSMTAGAFAGWLTGIQVGLVLLGKYLDFQDKAQKRQGELQRAFGSTNVSIGESFKAASAGWSIAGKTGAEAAEQLNYVARQARGTLMTELMGGERKLGMTGLEQLIALTAGVSKKTPEYVETLTTAFGVRGAKELEDTLTKIYTIALKSGAPIDMMADMIFKLGEQYIFLGGSAESATNAMIEVSDAIGRTKLPPALAQRFMQIGMEEQMTAGGLQGRFLTTTFASRMFGTFPQELQNTLNNAASKLGYTGFQSMPFMRRAELMGNLPPETYLETKRGELAFARNIAKTQGEPVATAITQQLSGMEFKQLDDLFRKLDEGQATQAETVKQFTDSAKSAPEKMVMAQNELLGQAKDVAKQQQEFYSDLLAGVKNLQSGFITLADALIYGEKGFRMTREHAENITGAFEETIKEAEMGKGAPLTGEEVSAMLTPRIKAAYVYKEYLKTQEQEVTNLLGQKSMVPTSLHPMPLSEFIAPETIEIDPKGKASYIVELTLRESKRNPATTGKSSGGTQSSYKTGM